MTDDIVIDTFTEKLRQRVAFKGTIAKRDDTARWSKTQTRLFIFGSGLATWWGIIAAVNYVAKLRGFV